MRLRDFEQSGVKRSELVCSMPYGLFRALALNRHGDLRRHELEHVLFVLPVDRGVGVILHDDCTDGLAQNAKRDSQPDARRLAEQFHLALPFQLVMDRLRANRDFPVRRTYAVSPFSG